MSLADNKRAVFTKISSLTSLAEDIKNQIPSDTMTSINNKDEIIPYLLDILKTVAGVEAIKKLIGDMFTEVIGQVEPKLKSALINQFIQGNADELLPTELVSNGFEVPVKKIDIKGKFKVNPNSDTGNLIYGVGSDGFDELGYNAILNSGSEQINSNLIGLRYIESSDSFQIKLNLNDDNVTIGSFFTDFINDTEIINEKELMSSVMDSFYGTLTNDQNKSVTDIYNNLSVEELLKQALGGDDSFELSPQKYDELQKKARELAAGIVTYDLGCGLMSSELDFSDFTNLINNISGSADSNFIGDQIINTINQSTSDASDLTDENKNTVEDSFLAKIMDIFTVKMLEAVTTAPQVRSLFAIMSYITNEGDVIIGTVEESVKSIKVVIKCLAKVIIATIAAYVFSITINYLIYLVKPVIKKVVREKLNQHVGIMKSLVAIN